MARVEERSQTPKPQGFQILEERQWFQAILLFRFPIPGEFVMPVTPGSRGNEDVT